MSAEDWIGGEDPEDWEPRVPEWAERNLRLKKWRTKDEHEIPLKAMSDKHLENSILYIKRQGPDCIYGLGDEWLPILEKELQERKK
jgi:hypothetical protein